MLFDDRNVVRDKREKESEISSTPTTSSRVLVLTASCKNGGAGVDVVTVASARSSFHGELDHRLSGNTEGERGTLLAPVITCCSRNN
jgi:hypothetical protein